MRISRYVEMNESVSIKQPPSTIIVSVDGKTLGNESQKASITFCQAINHFIDISGEEFEKVLGIKIKGAVTISVNRTDFASSAQRSLKKIDGYLINTHCSTDVKKKRIDELMRILSIDGSVDIVRYTGRIDSEVEEEMNVEEEDSIEFSEDVDVAINPFGGESMSNSGKESSAICVLGRSGAGKTYRIEKTLDMEGHVSEVIIPSSSTTNLLVQYTKGEYVLSRLGRFILMANSDRSKCYTVVFDECHKYIDMINDELLQCISTKRNAGLRFISLDPVTDELFDDLSVNRGRRIIPDNLGFIFISSKEEVIRNNSDFFNRVDIITIDKSDRDIEFAIEVLKDKIEHVEDEGYSME